jgi:L-alanine-DL-glutamate epimerase-like enolase superfamily enzyme
VRGLIKGETKSIGCLLVFLDTDEGITGESLLFAFDPGALGVLDEMVRFLAPEVIGEDPQYTERIWQRLWQKTSFLGHQGVAVLGLSAFDRACWDIVGKTQGRPLYKIFGACRDSAPAYASGLWLALSIDELIAEARGYIDDGFRAMKMRIGTPRLEDDVERVRAVRDAIGADVDLMVDANRRFTVDHAIRLGRRLEAFDLAWFEEPVAAHDLAGSARVAAALDVPIASGEGEFTRYGFKAMLDHKAADILMPDMGRVGGLTEMLKVAHMAEAYDIPVTPHSFPQESMQVVGSIPNGTYVECLPWFAPLYRDRIAITEGRLAISQSPGNGSPLDPEAIERYRISADG